MVSIKKIKSKKRISFKDLFSDENALIDQFIKSNTLLNTISLVGLFIVFQYLFSQIRFFIPDNPVPVTMQTFGILLVGGLYGPRLTLLSIFSYMIIGIIGVPVFQSHNGGIDYFFGVTGGYLIGFIFASVIISILSNSGLKKGLSIWAMIIGNLMIYITAIVWLSVYDFGWPEKGKLFSQAVYPFLIGDFIKLILASLSINILWKLSNKNK
ncbi:MAG: biotin transporter BioY [Chloroflexota bacterium]|nr:biotin transporter BioY [Chloroflexota bacterium]MEC8440069.1 biotin transporter BioY [Chloroflexota bacterium]MEE2621009.1 biotin transporter BioY [Chloroflexota bacterium]|tara:strand:+ start:1712 stop:2344 length:633 start_codon:yes stop_codon:yes gene_type:complete